MKIVIISLLLPVAILSFLPERAWAPPAIIQISGDISLISFDDNAVTGEPWADLKPSLTNQWNSPPDSGQGLPPGGPWW